MSDTVLRLKFSFILLTALWGSYCSYSYFVQHEIRIVCVFMSVCIQMYMYMCAVLYLVARLCLTLWDLMDCSPPGSSVNGISPGKNTRVGCHAFLQGIFLTQGLNLNLLRPLHWQAGSLPLASGKPFHFHYFIQNLKFCSTMLRKRT